LWLRSRNADTSSCALGLLPYWVSNRLSTAAEMEHNSSSREGGHVPPYAGARLMMVVSNYVHCPLTKTREIGKRSFNADQGVLSTSSTGGKVKTFSFSFSISLTAWDTRADATKV
jgi:hypothetical protein